jgi:hypothetical protein
MGRLDMKRAQQGIHRRSKVVVQKSGKEQLCRHKSRISKGS